MNISKKTNTSDRNIIIGTDWWTDCDDAGAVRIACRADNCGLWNILGIAINACMPDSAASLNAFCTSEGKGDIPLGIDRTATGYGGNPPYQALLTSLPHRINGNAEIEDALALYLRLLESVDNAEIIEIGYPQVLAALCADPVGYGYLKDRVKCLWMMAGNWEKDGRGRENNIARTRESSKAAAYLFEHCPCPIVLLGWEVGASVISGTPEAIPDDSDPLRMAYIAHGSIGGRSSWDPMLMTLALTGDIEKAGYTIRRGYASADAETGENSFVYDDCGPHGYVVKSHADEWYASQLDRLLGNCRGYHAEYSSLFK